MRWLPLLLLATPSWPVTPVEPQVQAEGPDLSLGGWALVPEVVVALGEDPAAARRAPEVRARPLRWDKAGDRWVSELVVDRVLWKLAVEPVGPQTVRLTATATPGVSAFVGVLGLELALPAGARALDRGYRWTDAPVHQDRHTPQRIDSDAGWWWAHAQAVDVRGGRARIELDHAANHPFRPFRRCEPAWSRAAELDRIDLSAAPATEARAEVILGLGTPPPFLPLRYPDGDRSALVFTDHADQADARTLSAVLWGETGAEADAGRGIAGRGLRYTKTIFAKGWRRDGDLTSPAFREVLTRARHADVEIGAHSGSDRPEDAVERATNLRALAPWGATTWIDHQPITNCEALLARGWQEGPWNVVPDLTRHAYRYAWSAEDRDEPLDGINLLDPGRPGVRPAALYPHPLAGPVWLFPSQWRAVPRARFVTFYADDKLDRLARDRGLHLAHTYLDAAPGSGPGAWTLFTTTEAGFRLHDDVDARFAALAERQARGEVRVGTLAEIADHLRAMGGLRYRPGLGGRLEVTNPGDRTVYGAAFSMNDGWPAVNGHPLPPIRVRDEPDGRVFDVDLPPGTTVIERMGAD
jgi:hypothetical protein